MKIVGLTVWKVPLTSHATYYMASGKTCATVDTIVVRIDTDSGHSGWGEVCPIPHYLPAYADGVAPAIGELWPVLKGRDPRGAEAVIHACNRHLPGHAFVKSPIDIALWDITAKAADLPLYALLGGAHQTLLPIYHSITCVEPQEMADIASKAHQSGIRQFQVKLGADDDWAKDVARLMAVRQTVGDGPLVYGDWNCGSTPLTATRVARAVRDLDVMLEQPCETIAQCAEVKNASGLPMKLDENARDFPSLLEGFERNCLDAVAIKLSKFGGLSACRRARDVCVELAARMCIEDTWGSDIATCAALHLGAATPSKYLMNVCDLSGYVAPRLDRDAPTRENGMIRVPEGPGLGVSPDPATLGKPIAVFE